MQEVEKSLRQLLLMEGYHTAKKCQQKINMETTIGGLQADGIAQQ